MDAVLVERARLIRQAEQRADAARRSWSLTLQTLLALFLFALAPSIPHARHLFGELTLARTFAIIGPAALGTLVLTLVYRRFGGESRVYRVAEWIETFAHYAVNVGTVFGTAMTWPVLWILCPFSTAYMAVMKPFNTRMYTWVVGAWHVVLAALYVARGDAGRAPIALAVGMVSYAVYGVIALQGRRTLTAEAERNVAQARLNEATLDQARRQVATALRDRIGHDIAALASELDPKTAAQASSALLGLEEIVGTQARSQAPASLSDLLARIDEKCRPLCADVTYESALLPSDGSGGFLDAARALAAVRIAQELVRNARVHGGARTVRVELASEADASAVVLRVADDGSGLTSEQLARASGGLENAARWLGELGGTLDLEASTAVQRRTTLRCRLPRGA